MEVQFIVVGLGVSGIFLSDELRKAGYSVLVFDAPAPSAASRVAAGVINPVTGRRLVRTWMIEDLMPEALQAYTAIGEFLNISCIRQCNVLDFFPTPQMRAAFIKRIDQGETFLRLPPETHAWKEVIRYDFGVGEIDPCYLVNLQLLVERYRQHLLDQKLLVPECFDQGKLEVNQHLSYNGVKADKIIFCDGIAGMHNRWFYHLPFAANKGEALLIRAPDLPRSHIVKKGLTIAPWSDDIFWVGSSYVWEFGDDRPSGDFRRHTIALLAQWIRVPFEVIDHLAAIRPATLERRPFIGWHPLQPNVGIFNGMGTKGCSLAPWFARHFVASLTTGGGLQPEADVGRFRKILSRA